MKAVAILATVAAAAVLGTGCGLTTDTEEPACSSVRAEPLYLVAQAVPTAERIPCITGYPGGWKLGSVDVHNGQASFALDSDRGGSDALTVTLRETCDVAGAIEVTSDKPGTARFDAMPVVDTGFRGVRSYLFDGGCVTYRFDVRARRAGVLVDEGSLAVGFLTRADVEARLEEEMQS
jgi:hypothetical protein